MTRLLAIAAVVVVFVEAGNAQSLGEAARRAEEARKANAPSTLTFDARDVDPLLARQELLGVTLDAETWRRYLVTDRRVAAALASDPGSLRRFEALEVSSIRAMDRFLQKEQLLAGAIAAAGSDVHDFASVHLAVVLAKRERSTPTLNADVLPRSIKENIAFITAHERDVNGLATPPARLALRIIPPAPRRPSPASPAAASASDAVVAPPSSDGPIDVRPGADVPDFQFIDLNGNSRSLTDFRGKYVLLDFWGSWCGPCRAEVPYAKDAYARFRSRGFEILALDYEPDATLDEIRGYVRDNGITWTFAQADSVRSLITERFRVRSFPTLILLDPDRRVVEVPGNALRGRSLARTLDAVLPQ